MIAPAYRTIGKLLTSGVSTEPPIEPPVPPGDIPEWAQQVVANPGKLFDVGGPASAMCQEDSFVWPETTFGGGLYHGTDGTFSAFWDAYGSMVFVPELGPRGTLVFGGTGEGVIAEQLACWDAGAASPVWAPFQHPKYATSDSQAAAMGTTWYYNPAECEALKASNPSRIIPWAPGTGAAEGDWQLGWDKQFPVGRAGWIITGKTPDSELGDHRPMAFRYNYPQYVPPSMTGWEAGAIITTQRAWGGSFNGHNGPPYGVTPADWFTSAWPSGRRKHWAHAMNVKTKQWSVLPAPVPDFVNSYQNLLVPEAFVDEARKRVYYTANHNGKHSLYYCDLSDGIAGATWSGPAPMADAAEGGSSHSHSNGAQCRVASGPNAGKLLYYLKDGFNRLGLIDPQAMVVHSLNVANPPPAGGWQFGYDAATNRVHITVRSGSSITCSQFEIPDDPANGAAYAISTESIDLNGVTLEAATLGYPYGARGRYHSQLGGLVLLNQRYGKMLAFKPRGE